MPAPFHLSSAAPPTAPRPRPPLASLFLLLVVGFAVTPPAANQPLLNASFDVSREFYEDYNLLFLKHYQQKTGQPARVYQSHAGSAKQARSVLDGFPADVLTMNQPLDIDIVVQQGQNLVSADWQSHFPHNASPCTTTVAFMVRRTNPKNISDWPDLLRTEVTVVLPNPKTSGSGRYAYLAAWASAAAHCSDEAAIRGFISALFRNVPTLDTGGRGATTTFVHRGIGDVLVSLESEILTTIQEAGADKFQIVYPALSIEAEMPVAVVERVVKRKGTGPLANEYLHYLYSEPAQELFAVHGYRPRSQAAASKCTDKFPPLQMLKVDDVFGGWAEAQKRHFNEGGSFDQIYSTRAKGRP